MDLARKIVVAIVLIAFVVTVIIVAGSLSSYDWRREHTSAVSALPELGARHAGLVRIDTGDLEFRARVVDLDARRTPVLLLHGFPETSAMWTPLLDALARDGRPAVAFDQRGYSPAARPRGVEPYQLRYLVADVLAVADALGWSRFHLVGHDWGAAVGWMTTLTAADRVVSWTALSIPHPAAFGRALAQDPEQQSRSRYFLLFRTPWLPETLFSCFGFKLLESMYSPMSAAQREEYLEVFAEPGALTAALNWYRAMDASPGTGAAPTEVARPVLFIWGRNDVAVSRAAVDGQRDFLAGRFEEVELDAGHWLMEEAPDEVVPRVVAFVDGIDAGENAVAEAPVGASGARDGSGDSRPAARIAGARPTSWERAPARDPAQDDRDRVVAPTIPSRVIRT